MGKKPLLRGDDLAQLLKDSPVGIVDRNELQKRWGDVKRAIQDAKSRGKIGTYNQLVYDPDRIQKEYAIELSESSQPIADSLPDFALIVRQTLAEQDAPALVAQDLEAAIGGYFSTNFVNEEALYDQGVALLTLQLFPPYVRWYYAADHDYQVVYDYALTQAQQRQDDDWQLVLDSAGDAMRDGAQEGESVRNRALARLYNRAQVESILDITERLMRVAMREGYLTRIECPDSRHRIRAVDVHRLRDNPELRQSLEDEVEINIWQVRNLTDLKLSYLRTLLHNQSITPTRQKRGKSQDSWFSWGDIRRTLWPQGGHPSITDIEAIEEAGGTGRKVWWSDTIYRIHKDIADEQQRRKETKEKRRRERTEQREQLRSQMIDNFPSWMTEIEEEQVAYIHVGPTNSGKTHVSLQELADAGSGWYLAPLRLLAREMYEKLNRMGVLCNLVTGEERILVPSAAITAATVEMFNPDIPAQCIVIDEAHLVGDDQRGWAWTRALVNAHAPQLRVITAPHGLSLLKRIFENRSIETQVRHHERLVPLEIADRAWELHELPPRTILVAFSRRDVLRLKFELQQLGRSVAVVYGALPPEVRLKQAERFAYGEVEICVATDAIGMGLNLPADHVVFSTMTKFDGKQQRKLRPSELQQIAGRAGRYQLSEQGLVTGLDGEILRHIRKNLHRHVGDIEYARLAPRTDEIELLQGDLVQRLLTWQELNAIPDELRGILRSTDLQATLELASLFSYDDLMTLGIEKALILVSAPVRKESQEYWVECATAILRDELMPLPPPPPSEIVDPRSLKDAEAVIACIDIYVWLGYREPFRQFAEEIDPIIEQRNELTTDIDLALIRRFDPTLPPRRRRRRSTVYDDF